MTKRGASPGGIAAFATKRFADQVAQHVTQFAFDAMLDVSERQHEGLGGVALMNAVSKAAQEVGGLTIKAVMLELLTSGVLSDLARAARAQGARKAGVAVSQRKGAKRAAWKDSARQVLKKRRNLDVPSDELIEALVQGLVIDRANEGFECHQTGDRVASSRKNLVSEISKLKAEVLKTRAKPGN